MMKISFHLILILLALVLTRTEVVLTDGFIISKKI